MNTENNNVQTETIYKNLIDIFDPACSQLENAAKGYFRALQAIGLAHRDYCSALAKVAQSNKSVHNPKAKQVGICLDEVVDYQQKMRTFIDGMINFYGAEFTGPLTENTTQDKKILTDALKSYKTELKLHEHDLKVAGKNYSRSNDSTSRSNYKQAMDKLNDFKSQANNMAQSEELKRYTYILDRHNELLKISQDKIKIVSSDLETKLLSWISTVNHVVGIEEPVETNQMDVVDRQTDDEDEVPNSDMEPTLDGFIAIGETELKLDTEEESTDEINNTATKQEQGTMTDLPELEVSFTQTVEIGVVELEPEPAVDDESIVHRDSVKPDDAVRIIDDQFDDLDDEQDKTIVYEQPFKSHVVTHQFKALEQNQISLTKGDRLELLMSGSGGWKFGRNTRTNGAGWFPGSYTREAIVKI